MASLPMSKESEVDAVLAILRAEMLAPGVLLDFTAESGMEECENWETGLMQYRPNGSRTYTITINGGAHDTKGEPIR